MGEMKIPLELAIRNVKALELDLATHSGSSRWVLATVIALEINRAAIAAAKQQEQNHD